ncbi:MAG: DNA topoisomerase (ATP-hydrolyzing) subunit B [Acidimicrobiia bacterium]|nr:DNA topoisomerase (ATP-hydrolyzing) subunit B [Acidimicrobiia bacterium]MDQ3500057.1 DNA topoisomerase (ATP-hydrolyzing) subunit B [Actinomycetota bacterium]
MSNGNTSYDARDIKVLEGLEAVRKRPSMYIGSTGPRGLHHLVWEVVDNSVDEAMAGFATRIDVSLLADGGVRVIDDGRGIPVDVHPKSRQSALTVVLSTLHAGGKFEEGAYTVSGGLHGVGVSVVNALSSHLSAEIRRDGFVWGQSFQRGKALTKVEKLKPWRKNTGTTINFWPDNQIFTDTLEFDYDTVATRLRELAYLNRGLEISLRDEREPDEGEEPRDDLFHFKGGLVDFVKHLNANREPVHAHVIELIDRSDEAELELAMQWTGTYTESILSFANNINTHEGGTHEEGFRKAMTNAVNAFARQKGLLKEKDDNLTGEDIREGLTAVLSLRVRNPQFEGQTKTKLGNTEIRSYVEKVLNRYLPEWLERYSTEARRIVEKCITAAKAREAARKARDLTRRKSGLESGGLPDKLADCSTRNPEEAELFIVEGKSAAGPAKQGRNSHTQAVLPIRGKILNVEKSRLAKALQNTEIIDLITAVGTGIGDEFDLAKARYHKVILLADADVDGSHIRTLLLTFLFRHMRGLIEGGFVYIAQPPLYRVKVGSQVHYLKDDSALAAFRQDHPKVRPARFKGLGEMDAEELRVTTMDPETRTLLRVEVEDAFRADQLFSILMGDDVAERKHFIQQNAKDVRFLDI